MKSLTQILRIPWTDRKTNDWVCGTAEVQQNLLQSVERRKMTDFWHAMRKEGECLEKDIIQGTIPGTRRRGRPKTSWISNITSRTGLGLDQLLQTANNRDVWRKLVHSATNHHIQDGYG